MHKIKFFKDFANIMDWAYTQHHGCQDGTDQTLAYAAALEPMKKLNDELFNFFGMQKPVPTVILRNRK